MQKYAKLIAVTLCLAACSPSVEYLGRNYTATTHVDIFFDTHDIKKDYAVMGKIDGIAGILNNSYQEIQDKIVKEAQTRGADAVVIYNMEQRVVGTSTNSTTRWDKEISNHRQWLDKGVLSTSTMSTPVTENVLHADFIKYNNN